MDMMSSPKILRKISRHRAFRVLVLGQPAVGKTALTVRFITKRFIGEYDPTLERKYSLQTDVDGDPVAFDILDTAGQIEDFSPCEEQIRWADAYILIYDVTDRCSFDECTRLKFLINVYSNRKSRKSSHNGALAQSNDIPVALVGNKNDLAHERMVSYEEGRKRSEDIGCTAFHDLSVRECIDEVRHVFVDLLRTWPKKIKRNSRTSPPMLKDLKNRSMSEEDKCANLDCTKNDESKTQTSLIKRKESVSRKLMKRVIPGMRHKSIEMERQRTESDSSL